MRLIIHLIFHESSIRISTFSISTYYIMQLNHGVHVNLALDFVRYKPGKLFGRAAENEATKFSRLKILPFGDFNYGRH